MIEDDVVKWVTDYFETHGHGITRDELAGIMGVKSSRHLRGVRAAINEQRICYDGTSEGRLIPWTAYAPALGSDEIQLRS